MAENNVEEAWDDNIKSIRKNNAQKRSVKHESDARDHEAQGNWHHAAKSWEKAKFASVSSGNNTRTDQLRNRHKAVLMKAKRTTQLGSKVQEDIEQLNITAPVALYEDAQEELTENPLFDFLDARAAEAVNNFRDEISGNLFDAPEGAVFVADDSEDEEEEVTEEKKTKKKGPSKKEREERDRADYEASIRQRSEETDVILNSIMEWMEENDTILSEEEIVELSKDLLGDYVKSSAQNMANHAFRNATRPQTRNVYTKEKKRMKGIVTAVEKLKNK